MKKSIFLLITLVFSVFLLSACASDINDQKKPASVISPEEEAGNSGAAVEQTPEEIASIGIADLDRAASELDELGDI
ncbi:hypothetical protein HYV84_03960 [Candidatus Woesearchaeota archaeon]|nr:hypothetical protein [Candidatus Woesearchaeota archaeon]